MASAAGVSFSAGTLSTWIFLVATLAAKPTEAEMTTLNDRAVEPQTGQGSRCSGGTSGLSSSTRPQFPQVTVGWLSLIASGTLRHEWLAANADPHLLHA